MALRVRQLTESERQELDRRSRSSSAPFRDVQRAKVILLNADGKVAPAIGRQLGVRADMARRWIRRFNERGLDGLAERPRAGRKRPELIPIRTELVRLARTRPTELGYPFADWTIERLQVAVKKRTGRLLSTQTVWTWLKTEGIRWRRQESWLRPELNTPEALAEFEEKRGPSSERIKALKPESTRNSHPSNE